MENDKVAARPQAAPVAVGVLLLLYGLGLFVMSDGEANPALVLLAAVLGLACIAWGLRGMFRR